MAEEASVSDILEGVGADVDVLEEALKHDSADEYQVPEGQEPAQPSQAVVVASGRSVCLDPADQSVASGGVLEAKPLAWQSPPPRRSPFPAFSPHEEGFTSTKESDQHHRRTGMIRLRCRRSSDRQWLLPPHARNSLQLLPSTSQKLQVGS